LKRITDYKAIYINTAVEAGHSRIDEALAPHRTNDRWIWILTALFHVSSFYYGFDWRENVIIETRKCDLFLLIPLRKRKKKIMNAKNWCAVTLQEQKKFGGRPDECMIYELFLYHLIEE